MRRIHGHCVDLRKNSVYVKINFPMAIVTNAIATQLRDDYFNTTFPLSGTQQDNVSAAFFSLSEVQQLLDALPANTPYIKVFLVLEANPLVPNTRRVTMAMSGADSTLNRIAPDVNGGGGQELLVADRPCPPDCEGHQYTNKIVIG